MEALQAGLGGSPQQSFWNRRAHPGRLSVPGTQHAQQVFIRARGLDLAQFVPRRQSSQTTFRDQTGQTAVGNSADQPGSELRGVDRLNLSLLNLDLLNLALLNLSLRGGSRGQGK